MTGTPIDSGDFLLDERGLVYQVIDTPPTVQKESVIYTNQVTMNRKKLRIGVQGFVYKRFALKVSWEIFLIPDSERKLLWKEAFIEHQVPIVTEEIAQRHREIQAARIRTGHLS